MSLSSRHESSSDSTAGTSAPAARSAFSVSFTTSPSTPLSATTATDMPSSRPSPTNGAVVVDVLLELLVLLGQHLVRGLALLVLLADAADLAVEPVDDALVDDRGAHEDAESERQEHGNERDEVKPEVDHGEQGEPRRRRPAPTDQAPGSREPAQNQFVIRSQVSENIRRKPSRNTWSECDA